MKILPVLLLLPLLLFTGCYSSFSLTHSDPHSDPYYDTRHADKYNRDPEPDHPGNRTPLSSYRTTSQVWVVDGRYHDGPNCEKAFRKTGGKFMFFNDARYSDLRPCRFCIDVYR